MRGPGKLRESKLIGNLKKCEFFKQDLEFLGHIITAEGIKAAPTLVKSVLEWPTPVNVKQLRGFLGASGFYWRLFVKSVLTRLRH